MAILDQFRSQIISMTYKRSNRWAPQYYEDNEENYWKIINEANITIDSKIYWSCIKEGNLGKPKISVRVEFLIFLCYQDIQ